MRFFDLEPSPDHSAHVGQIVKVHYRWHALHGREVRLESSECRRNGRFVYVEVSPGTVLMIAAWMLDAAACSAMEIGAPRVVVSALFELHQLLIDRDLRASFRGDSRIIHEEQNEEFAKSGSDVNRDANDLAPTCHCIRLDPALRNESDAASEGALTTGHPVSTSSRTSRGRGAQK